MRKLVVLVASFLAVIGSSVVLAGNANNGPIIPKVTANHFLN